MNIQVKQRVVGAIVLVALAVIFLPILLPGKGDLAPDIDESNVPPAPDYRFQPLAEAPEPPAPMEMATVPLEVPASKTTTAESTELDNAASAPLMKPETVIEKKPLSQPKASAKRIPKPGEISGWIVQLGSFSSQSNAMILRDKLRAKGYSAFVEAVNNAGKSVFRVRVGPELRREAADKLREKLVTDMNMTGLVQQYP